MKKMHGSGKHKSPPDGGIPWVAALRILGLAHPHFQKVKGIGLGQLILKYQSGECKITPVETTPPTTNTYRVQMLGNGVTLVDTES